ncbi:glutamate-rich protein 6B [Paroedura picta]|uniref:glutamate-rich protein 6B n=1 Tax=Paroedura picta TaxID=143630 RepID=UPI0040578007
MEMPLLGNSKADSSEKGVVDVGLESLHMAEDHYITDYCTLGFCEFCATALKPFPTPEELEDKPEKMDSVPCCRTYKEILKCVMQELMGTQTPEGEIDISPHPRLSQNALQCKTRNVLMEELHEHGIENYKDVFEQYMRLGPWVRVGYKLSDHSPKQPPAAAVKRRPRAKEVLKIDREFKPEQVKICHPTSPVKKYYPDGKIFLLLLPDGTGQVYYPSGNVAVLITYLEKVQFTYVVLADGPSQRLRAFFTNQGYAACYFPNGTPRVHLDLCHGSSFDERGLQEKRWCWWDASRHIHAPPFQPISLQLNSYIHVKITAQDRILLTFEKLHSCIHLNVGARLKLEDPSMLPFLQWPKKPRMSVSQAKARQIKTLLDELRKGLKLGGSLLRKESLSLELTATILLRLKRWRQRKAPESPNPSWDSLS